MQNRRRGISPAALIVPLIILVVGGVLIYFFIYRPIVGESISVGAQPLIAVESCSTVRVIGDTSNTTVTIKTNTSKSSSTYMIERDGNALYIKGRGCWDMTLQVPAHSDVQIIATTGIEVYGVTGVMLLKGGTVVTRDVHLEGKSSIESSSEIFFNGVFEKGADVLIKSGSDPLDIELPSSAAFTLTMKGAAQSFNTTFSEIVVRSGTYRSSIQEFSTRVGGEPQATLTIQASSTAILLTGI